MAETIKGINVVIGSDTTGLSAALSDVNKKSKDIQSELKQVEKLLKLDPSNTDLVAQKQKLLGDAVANTSEKLDRLKTAQQQVNEQFAKGDISEGQYRAFQREIAKTEQELGGLKGKLTELNGDLKEQSGIVEKLGKDYKESFEQAQQSLGNSFDQIKKVGAGVTAASAAIAGGLGLAVKSAADFEQGMANVFSVMAPDEVVQFKDELKQLAVTMGADTKYSATEAAKGIEELVKAGVSIQDVLEGGLQGALSLATAGELELGDAAEIASTALNAFRNDNLSVSQAADILAGAANASATSVSEMKFGLSQVSAVASGVGLSFKDTSTALAVFAQNGLKGSDAGTSLKTMLLNLQPSTKQAAEEMKQLGIITEDGKNQFIDAEGRYKDLSSVSDILRKSLSGLTDAQRLASLQTMFGTDAIRAANILYKEGAEGVNGMAEAMGKISANDVAAQKLNTFKGAMEELSGAVETAQISVGEALLPMLRVLTGVIQRVVNIFNGLPEGVKSFLAISGALIAALGLIVGPLLLLIGFIPQLIAGFTALAPVIGLVGMAFTVLTGPIGLIIAAIAALGVAIYLIIKYWDDIKAYFIKLWSWIDNFFGGWGAEVLAMLAPFIGIPLLVVKYWGEIKAGLSALWEWAKGFFSQWGGILLPLIAPFLAIPLLIVKHWEDIKAGLSALWKWIKDTAIELFNNTKDGFIQIWDGIKDYFTGIWKLIKNIFAGALLLIIDLVTGDFDKLKTDAIQIWDNLKDSLSQIWEGIKKMFAGSLDVIKGYFSTAWNAIKSVASTIWTEITDGIDQAINWIRNLPQTMTDLGKNMIQGLIDGIKNMIGKVGDVAKSIADKVTGGLRNALDIHSPSRVLMQLGEYTGEGFAKGLGNSITDVKQQVSAMASAATDVQGGVGGVAAGAVYNFDGMFAGAIFTVRNDSDVKRIAQELFSMQQAAMRGAGVR